MFLKYRGSDSFSKAVKSLRSLPEPEEEKLHGAEAQLPDVAQRVPGRQ